MKYLSLCSGIEAATVAWHPLGWEAVAYSEIERFPSEVLAHHYPSTPNLGDMTKFKEWNLGTNVDLLVGGTPCQSFSVAGLRKGLDDPRGNLMLTYLAIADKYRPRWLVWENVPGVLSSNGGKDFGVFLGALGELGYGFAYRVLDAQYFGVAQRRRRVFVVGYLGDWRAAAAVLFERHSLSGHPAPSREKRQSVAASVGTGVASGSDPDLMSTLCAKDNEKWGCNQWVNEGKAVIQPIALAENTIGRQPQNGGNGDGFTDGGPMYTLNATGVHGVAQPVYEMHGQDSRVRDLGETCSTVTSKWGTGGGNVPVTTQPIPLNTMTMQGRPSDDGRMGSGIGEPGDPAPTLTKAHSHAVAQPVGTDLYNFAITGDVAATMSTAGSTSTKTGPTVMQPMAYNIAPGKGELKDDIHVTDADATKTLDASGSNPAMHQGGAAILQSMAVRRLTPKECERLQGFPDNYTDIKSKGKPTPDGPRYKALGNSMAVPVMAWIGQRIQEVEAICKQNK